MSKTIVIELPDEIFEVYRRYAENHNCGIDEVILIPINDLAPMFARNIEQTDSSDH